MKRTISLYNPQSYQQQVSKKYRGSYTKRMYNEHQQYCEDKYIVPEYSKSVIFRQFNEDSLSRIWQHGQEGFILVSAFRGENSLEENIKRHDKLKDIVRKRLGGFSVLDGVWIENRGKPDEKRVSELSLFIPYIQKMSPDEFVDFAEELRTKFEPNQDAVVVRDPSKEFPHLMVIKKDGSVEIKKGIFLPDQVAEAYSRFKTGNHAGRTFVFEGFEVPGSMFSYYFMRTQGHIIL